ncbi:MAG TPA: toll/interleukin-1 receptor domain-containing protein [Blastocatellia bacterium]|nr:toll/interleukin-1 receptor domain-containing protein [Blastocatellia bacterium]
MKSSTGIFLNYAREDQVQVTELYRFLRDAGLAPWMDAFDLIGGEQWELAIKTAIRESHLFLACLSRHSVAKRGYVEFERYDALEILHGLPDTNIFLIPVRLEACEAPESLRKFQWVDLFAPDGPERLMVAIQESFSRRAVGVQSLESPPPPATPQSQWLTLAIDAGFLRRGSSQYLLCLQSESDLDLKTEEAKKRMLDYLWQQLPDDRTRLDVYFCLRGDHLIERYDYDLIGQLLDLALQYGWGEHRYVVVDERIGYTGVKDYDLASLIHWFDGVRHGNATDIIEVKLEPGRPDPNRLSKAANRSLERSRQLNHLNGEVNPGEEWRCVLPETSWQLAAFLRPFVAPRTFHGNLVLVVDSGDPAFQFRFVKSFLTKDPHRNYLVVAHAAPASNKLYSLCDEWNLKLVECRGPFELRYLLLRLNTD